MRSDGESRNIEDRRQASGGLSGIWAGGSAVAAALAVTLMLLAGADPRVLIDPKADQTNWRRGASFETPEEQARRKLVSSALAETEGFWEQQFHDLHRSYHKPKLVLYTDSIDSGCGFELRATGPFYCPDDQKIYLDLSFFDDMSLLGASGDFAMQYVIAHEVGHHVQKLLGVAASPAATEEARVASIRSELQADCLAGVWARALDDRHQLEPGDVDKALNAASDVGDDRLQRWLMNNVAPEQFTHGSSADRTLAFQEGFKAGTIAQCNLNAGDGTPP